MARKLTDAVCHDAVCQGVASCQIEIWLSLIVLPQRNADVAHLATGDPCEVHGGRQALQGQHGVWHQVFAALSGGDDGLPH